MRYDKLALNQASHKNTMKYVLFLLIVQMGNEGSEQ